MSDDSQFLANLTKESTTDDLLGSTLSGRYRLIKKLGEGGMGSVYLAEQIILRREVAIKVLARELWGKANDVERFLREARAASAITHENIVDIIDFGQDDSGAVYFAMEKLVGHDLSDELKLVGRIHWSRSRYILLQATRALAAAHAEGVVHRDMKPANVYMTKRGGVDFIKILDFGIAKIDDPGSEGLTRTGAVFGTAKYMSPEQCSGDPVDLRTDIYAMGIMMYEMLVGHVPFDGERFMKIIARHIGEPPKPLREAAPDADISPEVEALVLRAIAKEPDDRFATMAELESAILAAFGDPDAVAPGHQHSGPQRMGSADLSTIPPTRSPSNRPKSAPPNAVNLGAPPEEGTMMLPEVAEAPEEGTMMLDGHGSGALGGGEDGTMMLDGHGAGALGGGEDGTMMLDGHGADALAGGDSTMMISGQGGAMLAGLGASAAARPGTPAAAVATDASAEAKSSKMPLVIAGVVALLVAIGGAVAFSGGDDEVTEAVAQLDGESTSATAEPEAKPEPVPVPVAAEPEAAQVEAAPEPEPVPVEVAPEPEPEPEPAAPTKTKKTVKKKTVKKKAVKTGALSDAEISSALKRINKKVKSCASQGGLPGMKVKVSLSVNGGKVSASAQGSHKKSPVGKCVASAVGTAKFRSNAPFKAFSRNFTL